MPDVSGSAALEVLVGMFFLFFLLSIVASSMNEALASLLNMRAKYLERGVRAILGRDPHVREFYSHWRVRSLMKPPGRIFKGPRKPSYIPSRTFALTLLDTFAPAEGAADDHDLAARAERALQPREGDSRPGEIVRGFLRDALADAEGDRDRVRAAIEHSFDDVMERAAGWYKRKVQIFLFAISIGLVGIINADSLAIAQRLWKDDALRAAVVAQANGVVEAGQADCTKATDDGQQPSDAEVAAKCLDEVQSFALPLGWSHETSPHNVLWEGVGKFFGLLVTAFALALGAPFWFDLLGKVSNLRGAGRRDEPAPRRKPKAPGPTTERA